MLPRSRKSLASSSLPCAHAEKRGVWPSRFFSSSAVLGRSYNVSLPTATQVSRPETRCYLGYRYPCTRRGRQGASCALLSCWPWTTRPVATPIRTARRTAGAVADRARSSKLPDVRPVPRVPAPAAPDSLTQFVNPSAPKSYTPSHRRIGLERAVVTPLNPSHQARCCLGPTRASRSPNVRSRARGEEVCCHCDLWWRWCGGGAVPQLSAQRGRSPPRGERSPQNVFAAAPCWRWWRWCWFVCVLVLLEWREEKGSWGGGEGDVRVLKCT